MSSADFVIVTVQLVGASSVPLAAESMVNRPVPGSMVQVAVVSSTLHTMPPRPRPATLRLIVRSSVK